MGLFKQIIVFACVLLLSLSAAADPITSVTVTPTNVTCAGANDGTAAVTAITGGTAPYSYIWLYSDGITPIPGETDSTITGLAPGNYWSRVYDVHGDFRQPFFSISEPAEIVILIVTPTDATCNGLSDGSISILAFGGTGLLEYSITGGPPYQPGDTFNGLPFGNYNILVQDENTCTKSWASNPVLVDQPDVITITVDDTVDVTCSYLTDGYINVTVDGGNIPYTYIWTGPGPYASGDEDISNLDAGGYNLTVIDDKLCSENVGSLTIEKPNEITIDNDSTNDALCNGGNTGAIYVSVSEGTPGYTYVWNGPGTYSSTAQDIENLFTGTYDLEVTDANGCTKDHIPVDVNEPLPLSITEENPVVHVSCFGLNDGEISVNVSDGTGPYTYAWTGPSFSETTEDISGLYAGSYSLEVTDDNGCKLSYGPISVNEPPVLNVENDSIHLVSCNGLSDGGVFVTASDGTAPYSYQWTDGGTFSETTEDITGIPAANYNVMVTDINGCKDSLKNIPVTEPLLLTATTDLVTHVLCYGESTGSITVNVNGGTMPYSFAWSDGGTFNETTKDILNIPAASYTLTVTDANGCTDVLSSVDVNQPTEISVTTGPVVNVLCNGDSTGTIDISVTDGTPVYTYAWSSPGGFSATTQDIDSLWEDDYSVIVTDLNGCTMGHGDIPVSESSAMVITQDNIDHVSCFGAGDGSIYITVTGGAGGYGYEWTDGGTFNETTQNIDPLGPETYNLKVTDAYACIANDSVIITEPTQLTITQDLVKQISCFGDSNGAIYITPGGGSPAYSYSWTKGGVFYSNQQDVTGLKKETYALTLTDANGCNVSMPPVIIDDPLPIDITTVSATSKLALDCFGDNNGNIDIAVTGGTPGYTYDWTGPGGFVGSTRDISNLAAGLYILILSDTNNCTLVYADTVTQPPQLTISLAKTDITCFGDNDGTITITAGGGTPPYEYSRNGITWQDTTNVYTGLNPVSYTIYVRNTAGPPTCVVSDTISITEPQDKLRIITEFADNTNQNCFGDSNGVITITALGGTGLIEYSIDSGAVSSFVPNNVFANLPGGNYYTAITDVNGCLFYGSNLKVDQPPKLIISNYSQVDITTCYDSPTGQIDIDASGGASPFSYIMDAADTNQNGIFTGLIVGAHTINMIDAKGCTKDTTITIGSPPPIVVSTIDVLDVANCYSDSTGSLTIHASGGTGDLEFSIDGVIFQPDSVLSNLPGGDYDMQVRDDNGCLIYPFATINRPDSTGYDSIIIDPASCPGDTDGSITVYGSGGNPPYNYTLNPGAISNTSGIFTSLDAGTYTVSIIDALACPAYTTPGLDVLEPLKVEVDSVLYTEINCGGADNGTIEIFASGGNPPYRYSVNQVDFYTSSVFTGQGPAVYYTAVIDSKICAVWGDTITLTDPPLLILDPPVSTDVSTCFGDSTGSITVSASGGTGSLEYSLDSIIWQSTGDFVNLPAGSYTPLVRDSKTCIMAYATQIIDQPVAITATITTSTSMNGNPGSITISGATGGAGALVFSDDGPGGPFVTDTVFIEWPGFYDVVILDTSGCTYPETVLVDATPPLEVDVSFTQIDCYNNNNGTITLIPVNATGVVQYSIYDGLTPQATGTFTDLSEGTYLIHVLDEDMRIYWDTVDIINPPPFDVTGTVVPSTCSRFTFDGSITLNVSGGTPGAGYTYLWSNDSTTRNLSGLEEGTYTITITDANNCQHIESYDITAATTLIADAGRDTVLCYQEQYVLKASVVIQNAAGGPSYFWFPETGLDDPQELVPLATITDSITYVLTITEPGGCYDKDTLDLAVYSDRGLDAGQDTTVAIGQTINLYADGGPYSTYQWLPVAGLSDPVSQAPTLVVSSPVNYTVLATTEFGCVETDSMSINIASGLFIYSGFTPNGDGTNDLWDIDFVDYYPNITVAVFDRWGKQVFFTEGYTSDKRWDGKFKDKELPVGTYYYIIDLKDGSEPFKGPVSIVR